MSRNTSTPFSEYQRWIEAGVRKQKFGKNPPSLYEPIRYLMALGGKRLRPMLVLLSHALYRDDVRTIVPYAVAVESFHNFTLMHDDIMDKAPLRRGQATVHERWDTNTAILAGDVMLIRVYDMFLDLPAHKLREVLEAFNRCAAQVCEGQQWDMEFESTDHVSEKQYITMIRLKTAVLLGFSAELGAILADAPASERSALRAFGTDIGLGFQLKDDLLDAYADPRQFGKQVGGDILANKKTYLLIKALESARGKSRKELLYWLSATKFNRKEKIRAVKAIFDELGIPKAVEKKSNFYFQKGLRSLDSLTGDAGRREALRQYAVSLLERQS